LTGDEQPGLGALLTAHLRGERLGLAPIGETRDRAGRRGIGPTPSKRILIPAPAPQARRS